MNHTPLVKIFENSVLNQIPNISCRYYYSSIEVMQDGRCLCQIILGDSLVVVETFNHSHLVDGSWSSRFMFQLGDPNCIREIIALLRIVSKSDSRLSVKSSGPA